MLLRYSKFRLGNAPAAKVTIMVSPMAREMASTIDAIIPDNAAGNTTLIATSSFVEPSAYAALRMLVGTELIASSLRDEIMGKIMIPTTILALNALNKVISGRNVFNIGVTT